ncbi:MAG: hypothetical protein AAGA53_04625 [Pseudomonadota bacterium]
MDKPSNIPTNSRFSKHVLPRFVLAVFFAVLVLMITDRNQTSSADENTPKLTTNQSLIENQKTGSALEINNVQEAFEFVFSQLPDRVFVYPTENYYYFTFPANGVIYAGNLRLAAQDRDKGILHFATFRQANQAAEAGEMLYKPFTQADGVTVEKNSAFSYRVSYKNKSVIFDLNDVSDIQPPASIVAEGEKYLGLVVDESGFRFFLFYNEKHKLFAYILDETSVVPDQLLETPISNRIKIGARSGFAFYDHHYLDRRILIGVHGANTIVNNYFDGPADQLPENHIKNDNLRKAIVDSDPNVKGAIDKFGYFKNGAGRYLVAPYIQYLWPDELSGYEQCASDKTLTQEIYDACFYAAE